MKTITPLTSFVTALLVFGCHSDTSPVESSSVMVIRKGMPFDQVRAILLKRGSQELPRDLNLPREYLMPSDRITYYRLPNGTVAEIYYRGDAPQHPIYLIAVSADKLPEEENPQRKNHTPQLELHLHIVSELDLGYE